VFFVNFLAIITKIVGAGFHPRPQVPMGRSYKLMWKLGVIMWYTVNIKINCKLLRSFRIATNGVWY